MAGQMLICSAKAILVGVRKLSWATSKDSVPLIQGQMNVHTTAGTGVSTFNS